MPDGVVNGIGSELSSELPLFYGDEGEEDKEGESDGIVNGIIRNGHFTNGTTPSVPPATSNNNRRKQVGGISRRRKVGKKKGGDTATPPTDNKDANLNFTDLLKTGAMVMDKTDETTNSSNSSSSNNKLRIASTPSDSDYVILALTPKQREDEEVGMLIDRLREKGVTCLFMKGGGGGSSSTSSTGNGRTNNNNVLNGRVTHHHHTTRKSAITTANSNSEESEEEESEVQVQVTTSPLLPLSHDDDKVKVQNQNGFLVQDQEQCNGVSSSCEQDENELSSSLSGPVRVQVPPTPLLPPLVLRIPLPGIKLSPEDVPVLALDPSGGTAPTVSPHHLHHDLFSSLNSRKNAAANINAFLLNNKRKRRRRRKDPYLVRKKSGKNGSKKKEKVMNVEELITVLDSDIAASTAKEEEEEGDRDTEKSPSPPPSQENDFSKSVDPPLSPEVPVVVHDDDVDLLPEEEPKAVLTSSSKMIRVRPTAKKRRKIGRKWRKSKAKPKPNLKKRITNDFEDIRTSGMTDPISISIPLPLSPLTLPHLPLSRPPTPRDPDPYLFIPDDNEGEEEQEPLHKFFSPRKNGLCSPSSGSGYPHSPLNSKAPPTPTPPSREKEEEEEEEDIEDPPPSTNTNIIQHEPEVEEDAVDTCDEKPEIPSPLPPPPNHHHHQQGGKKRKKRTNEVCQLLTWAISPKPSAPRPTTGSSHLFSLRNNSRNEEQHQNQNSNPNLEKEEEKVPEDQSPPQPPNSALEDDERQSGNCMEDDDDTHDIRSKKPRLLVKKEENEEDLPEVKVKESCESDNSPAIYTNKEEGTTTTTIMPISTVRPPKGHRKGKGRRKGGRQKNVLKVVIGRKRLPQKEEQEIHVGTDEDLVKSLGEGEDKEEDQKNGVGISQGEIEEKESSHENIPSFMKTEECSKLPTSYGENSQPRPEGDGNGEMESEVKDSEGTKVEETMSVVAPLGESETIKKEEEEVTGPDMAKDKEANPPPSSTDEGIFKVPALPPLPITANTFTTTSPSPLSSNTFLESMQLRRSSTFYSQIPGNVRNNMENFLDGRPPKREPEGKQKRRRRIPRPRNGFLLHHGDNFPDDPEAPYRLHLATQILLKLNKRRAKSRPKDDKGKTLLSYLRLFPKRVSRNSKALPPPPPLPPPPSSSSSSKDDNHNGESNNKNINEEDRLLKEAEFEANITSVFSGEWTQTRQYVCNVCGQVEKCFLDMVHHKGEVHPGVVVTHVELPDLPPQGFREPPPPVQPVAEVVPNCTKCSASFSTYADFHLHIFECAGHKSYLEEPKEEPQPQKKKKKRKRGFNTFKRRLSNTPKKVKVNKTVEPGSGQKRNKATEVFKCEFCTREFKTEGWLKNHLTTHSLPIKIPLDKLKQTLPNRVLTAPTGRRSFVQNLLANGSFNINK